LLVLIVTQACDPTQIVQDLTSVTSQAIYAGCFGSESGQGVIAVTPSGAVAIIASTDQCRDASGLVQHPVTGVLYMACLDGTVFAEQSKRPSCV
jgi:hypothetical protein